MIESTIENMSMCMCVCVCVCMSTRLSANDDIGVHKSVGFNS